ncbi:MAG: FtsW/RodA/SpoVE family cell cycle protein [Oscillospiraceae bacterium]|nr:FtsW/RodA/SpoVE family cell cycle protein [Oscillospiraceae bacterium]
MKKIAAAVPDFFKRADMLLFLLCCTCSVFGIVVISSATASYETPRYLIVQIGAFAIGIGLFLFLTVIDIETIADNWLILMTFSVIILLLLIPFGRGGEETGNASWLRFLGVGLQPSEVVKVIFVVLLAKHISYLKEYKSLNSIISVGQMVLHFGFIFSLIIVVSGDLGSALVFFFVFFVMLFSAGLKLYWFVIGAAALSAITPFVWDNALSERQQERILAPYFSDIVDPEGFDVTWQANQSKLALSSGQLRGTGLGYGTQTQSKALPEKHTDFIFAVIGEELGMIACCAVIILLMLIVIRCVYIGIKSGNTMNMLVCFGVASFIFAQMAENIGMCIGVAPVIGITLPFFSYGGSSLFTTLAAAGLVSGVKYRPKPERFRSYG